MNRPRDAPEGGGASEEYYILGAATQFRIDAGAIQTLSRWRRVLSMKTFRAVLTLTLQLILLLTISTGGQTRGDSVPDSCPQTAELPRQLFGLTVDKITEKKSRDTVILRETIVEQLEFFKANAPGMPPPIVRFVLDVDGPGKTGEVDGDYVTLIREIKRRNLAYVMAELLDSKYIHYCTEKSGAGADRNCALERAKNYYAALGDCVDIWEVGNEVNGQWAGGADGELDKGNVFSEKKQGARGHARASVTSQVEAVYGFFEGLHKKTAITFYFNDDCERHSWSEKGDDREYAMPKWLKSYKEKFPEVDYVFISYYADDNFADDPSAGRRTRISPTAEKWADIFKKIKDDYQLAQVGFGEVGAQCKYGENDLNCTALDIDKDDECEGRNGQCCLTAQRNYASEYYAALNAGIREKLRTKYSPEYERAFVGGYFYWQFNCDVINKLAEAKKKKKDSRERQKLEQPALATRQTLLDAYKTWSR